MDRHARLYMSPPHMSGREQEYVRDVFASNWIAPAGPHLARFEESFASRVKLAAAVALGSGTAAIHLALRHLAIQPGDEVICPTLTFCASANPVTYEQGTPIFIDVDRATWNLDPNLVADELSACAKRGKLPRAIIAVDLLGQSADMDSIVQVASRYEIPVIEDAAEALGGHYKGRPTGSSGWVNVFSFNGNKIITTSGGGMLASNDQEVIERVRHLSTQARDPGHLYRHSEIGFNYRMSNVLAAIGMAQLEVLDERVATRKRICHIYRNGLGSLPGISFMPQAEYGETNYWLTVIQVDPAAYGATCEDVRLALEEANIESRRVWVPLHLQKPFANCRIRGGSVAEKIFETGLCLPSGSAMTPEDQDRVVQRIKTLHGSR